MRHDRTNANLEVALHYLGVDRDPGPVTGGTDIDAILKRVVVVHRKAGQYLLAQLLNKIKAVTKSTILKDVEFRDMKFVRKL